MTAGREARYKRLCLRTGGVTIVIPAYDEGEHLPAFLAAVVQTALTAAAPPVELIVVDDGSAADHQAAHAAAVAQASEALQGRSPHRVRLVKQPHNQGKGAAIRRGWAEADPEAHWLGFVDADGSVSAGELFRLVALLRPGATFDVLCGARVRGADTAVRRTPFRHLQGRLFALLVEAAFGLGLTDTQCGVKFARAERLRPIMDRLQERGWLLDVELLAALHRRGAALREVAVAWADTGSSHIRFGVDAARMAWGLLQLRRRFGAAAGEVAAAERAEGSWRDVA